MDALGVVPVLVLSLAAASCGGDDDDNGAGGGSQPSGPADEGREIARRSGCTACHGSDGQGGIGPAWAGSLGTEIELDDGTTVTVDEAYLRRSIKRPQAQLHAGFSVSMPKNQLSDAEIAKVVDYIVSLSDASTPETTG